MRLEPRSDDDLPLLRRFLGDARMTAHLGGPQTERQIREANRRHVAVAPAGEGSMFKVVVDRHAVGGVGYWQREWRGENVFEPGWPIHPEHQGRGFATRAVAAVIVKAREDGRRRFLRALPHASNAASKAVCRRLGLTLRGEYDLEYPKGRPMRCNDWRLDLGADLMAADSPSRG